MAQRRRSEDASRNTVTDMSARSDEARGESERDITNEEISNRAYELYERRGGEHGRDWDDWLEAENELRARRRAPGPTPS